MPIQPSGERPPRARTILVVSDDLTHRELCKAALEEAGFTVLAADGSSEALKILTQHESPIDLLLTDLILSPPEFQLASSANQFPRVNGFDLAIRAATIRQGLRVILTCQNRDKELAAHGISRTTLPVLTTPVDRQGLTGLVQDVLAQPSPTLSPTVHGTAANDAEWFG